jgi:hypothetical protein
MPLLYWVVPNIIAGGVLWFVAYQTAPLGREITLFKAIVTVFLIGLCGSASSYWLKPTIGGWWILVDLVAWTLIVMLMLKLSFWRSLLAVFVFSLVMIVAGLVIEMIAKKPVGQSPNPAHALDGGIPSVSQIGHRWPAASDVHCSI